MTLTREDNDDDITDITEAEKLEVVSSAQEILVAIWKDWKDNEEPTATMEPFFFPENIRVQVEITEWGFFTV